MAGYIHWFLCVWKNEKKDIYVFVVNLCVLIVTRKYLLKLFLEVPKEESEKKKKEEGISNIIHINILKYNGEVQIETSIFFENYFWSNVICVTIVSNNSKIEPLKSLHYLFIEIYDLH